MYNRGGINMYAKKFIEKLSVLLDYFSNINKCNEDNIRRFVDTEYREDDRNWAYVYFKNKTNR